MIYKEMGVFHLAAVPVVPCKRPFPHSRIGKALLFQSVNRLAVPPCLLLGLLFLLLLLPAIAKDRMTVMAVDRRLTLREIGFLWGMAFAAV